MSVLVRPPFEGSVTTCCLEMAIVGNAQGLRVNLQALGFGILIRSIDVKIEPSMSSAPVQHHEKVSCPSGQS